MTDIFEKASRSKLRFSYKGLISVEDLWDLTVEDLDDIYKKCNKELKSYDQDQNSLLKSKSTKSKHAVNILELKIALLKHIVEIKEVESEYKEKRKIRSDERQKILGIIAEKKNKELGDKSIEELMSLIGKEEEMDVEE